MPTEKFYALDIDTPYLTVAWGSDQPKSAGEYATVAINGHAADRSAVNRLITALKRARNRAFGKDA